MNDNYIEKQIQILINNFNAKNFNYIISKTLIYLKKFPEYVILYNLLGSSYQNIGEHKKAKNIFVKGLKYDPKNLALKNNLATTYKNLLQYDLAENLYNEIINLNQSYINAYVNLGNLKRDINKFDEAINLYETANKIQPKNPIILYSLALANQGLGNFEKAINYAKDALIINPKLTQADHLISQSMKFENENLHYQEIVKKLENLDLNKNEKIDLYFSLSKANEDMNRVDISYKFLKTGNDLKKEQLNYNIKSEINLFNKIAKVFKDIDLKKIKNNNKCNTIFILGMPRSGTSLVEQIISSHSNVFGAGELPILSNIIREKFMDNEELQLSKLLEIIDDENKINSLSNIYSNFIKYFNFNEQYITDKAPLNFRWIGFIKILFPKAKIIHCTRDPKNNCLSLYKNLFEGGLGFTYNETDLTEYYKLYSELMKFWDSKITKPILNVKYETLINNNEDEIKKIINYCGLNWEENCLSFHKNKTPIKTMSTAQARKPIYKSSLNSFDKFKKYLTVLEKKL